MTNPWDKNQGYNGPPESYDAYQRFHAFIKLGPSRTVPELAKRLGVTRQALGQVARRYNWVERAKAWDLEHPSLEGEPDPKIKEESLAAFPPPPPPPPIPKQIVVSPEIVDDPVITGSDGNASSEVVEYRNTFKEIGKEMLSDANSMRQLARIAHTDLQILWKKRIDALQAKDYVLAALLCDQIKDITPCYWKLRESVRSYRQDASTHWGNATGISELLKRVYG